MRKNYSKDMLVDHHLLEIILWPNEDGSFRTILNSRKRLRDLGIYKKKIMTIRIKDVDHKILHANNQLDTARRLNSLKNKGRLIGSKNGMYGRVAELNPFFGKKHTEDTIKKISENHIGSNLGNKNPQWKPDGPTSKYGIRNRKLMENPEAYQEHLRIRREKRAQKRRSMLVNSSVIEEGTSVCQ
jgi:hypothetical protein